MCAPELHSRTAMGRCDRYLGALGCRELGAGQGGRPTILVINENILPEFDRAGEHVPACRRKITAREMADIRQPARRENDNIGCLDQHVLDPCKTVEAEVDTKPAT